MKIRLIMTLALALGIAACSKDDNKNSANPKKAPEQKQEDKVVTGEKATELLTQKYKSIKLVCTASVATLVDEKDTSITSPNNSGSISTSPNFSFMEKEKFSTSNDGKNAAFTVDAVEALFAQGRDEIQLHVKAQIYEADVSLKVTALEVVRDSYDWVPSPDKENSFNGVQQKDTPEILVSFKRTIKKSDWSPLSKQTETSEGTFRVGERYAGSSFEDETTTYSSVDKTQKRTLSERLKIKCNAQTTPVEPVSP